MKTRLIIFGFCFLLSAFSRGQGWLPPYFGGSLKSTNATVTLLDELTLTNGLFAVWHLDETGTGTRYDSWGTNHLYVRATENVTSTNGMMSNAVNVTAAANGGDLTNDAAGMNFTDFTVSLWIYPKVHYNVVGSTYNLNEWTHFTVVYSNSAARHWIYRNGVLINSCASGTLGETSPTSFALVGKGDYGMRDEVMIWSRGLTPAEAALVYRMGQFKKWPERWR
jgi:hypothetical protein